MCEFCEERKLVKFSAVGQGTWTMHTNMKLLFGGGHDDKKIDCIFLEEGNSLGCDTSSGEYAPQYLDIKYCPFCGKELSKNDPSTSD